MTPADLLAFLRSRTLAVEATVAAEGGPQAAVVGYVVSDRFEVFFDTLASTRKAANLRANPRVALVMGWRDPEVGEAPLSAEDQARTAQCEGVADEPTGEDLERLQRLYFARFPRGVERQSWKGLIYVRVRLTWARYSDFRGDAPVIVEFDQRRLAIG